MHNLSSLEVLAKFANRIGREGFELVDLIADAEYRKAQGSAESGGIGCDHETRFVSTPDFALVLKFKRAEPLK